MYNINKEGDKLAGNKKKKFKKTFLQWFVESELNIEDYWDYELNILNPNEIGIGSEKKIWIKCQKHKYHGSYEITPSKFIRDGRCKYCSNNIIHYFDSLGFLYHDIAKMIVEDKRNNLTYMDTYKLAPYSTKKFYVKCLDCGEFSDKKIRLGQLTYSGYSCKSCSNTISLPNRFMRNLLKELNIDFIAEWCPSWGEGKFYDFYIPSLELIIEMDGGFHNNDTKYYSAIETKFIDRRKDFLANKHKIKVIRIECSYKGSDIYKNEKDVINNTYNKLYDVFNLNYDLLETIMDLSRDKDKIRCWELYNKGMNFKYLREYFGVDQTTIRNWCKLGSKLGKCDYTKKEYIKTRKEKGNNGKYIICLNNKKIFKSLSEASRFYNISINSISRSCNSKKYSPKHGLLFRKIIYKHNKVFRVLNWRGYNGKES